ncbi:MAG: NADH-quinone oxidoreductase subunit L [Acidobacteriia bacterium]|nr:NADH-quinone oxidoreductase subunit L [Terriglobia bacterium]
MHFLNYIWLIPVLPVLGAAIQLLLGRRLSNKAVSAVSVGLPGLSFLWALGCFFQLLSLPAQANHTFTKVLYSWLPAGAFHLADGSLAHLNVYVGFQLDPLSSVMMLVVTGVGFLIHVYSIGYMGHEGGYYRFFGYLNLFMFSMLVLVLADNYLMMFVGWEGVGLSSYFLIGFYFHRKSASDAGKKAFVVNRIGDAAFLLGMMLMAVTFGTLDFLPITEAARGGRFAVGDGVITAICILLFIGAAGKSAQIPLYVWLPDAMEGPTPVSALIHAATMVTAGVYMVARSNALYVLAPTALALVGAIGAATAIWAASIGLVQNDIKRVLAYSTVSQLGYMFLACGVGAFGAGIFHLMTHAFFKALLFLGAGSVIHALSGEQDLRKMGALWRKIPTTAWTMLAATLAISGAPLLSGFFSKDEILWQAFASPYGNKLLWSVGVVTAGLTAFYMFRLFFLTFAGNSRVPHEVEQHIHESPSSMTVPLICLGLGAVGAGYVGWPKVLGGSNWFGRFLDPVFENPALRPALQHTWNLEFGLMLLSVGVALVGFFGAYRWYAKQPGIAERVAAAAGAGYTLLLNKYYIDELYDALFVNRAKDLGSALAAFDLGVVDGGVNGVGWSTRMSAELSRLWDTWVIDGLVNVLAFVVKVLSYPARVLQTGLLQSYAWFITLGVFIFMVYYLIYF